MTVFRHFCEFCGIHFTSETPAKKYCSGHCKLKARHERAIRRFEALEREENDLHP
jgi:hypothetical protein